MMPKGRHFFFGLILSALVIFSGACQTTVGESRGDERYELQRSLMTPNYWETIVTKDVEPVFKAVLAGIKDLGLRITTSRADRLSGLVEGSFADGTEFKVKLSYKAVDTTLILINAGLMGSKVRSVQLFKAIEKHF
ncbi:DUF3568 family protein [Thermodesulfobacteriota bacterium]